MAYDQWVTITVVAKNCNLSIKNATLAWGKFHQCGNKDKEIPSSEINTIVIPAGNSATICACGRSDAASGTEGHIDIYDSETRIGNYYWDCPWGSKPYTSTWSPASSDGYIAQCTGGNLDLGLGNITITIAKF